MHPQQFLGLGCCLPHYSLVCGIGVGVTTCDLYQMVLFLSQIDFHGSFSEAHAAGDFGTVSLYLPNFLLW